VSNIIVDVVRKRGIKKLIFNVSQYAITIYISWLTLVFLSPDNTVILYKGHWPAMIVSSAVYVILNTILVSTVISLSEGRRPLRFLTRAINLEMLHFTLLVPVSLLIVILYTVEPMAIVILVLPLVLAHFSFDNYITLWTETRTTIEVLADIVDKKDPYTSKHSHMVADYCNDIAERIPLRPDDVETLVSAAKVHDLGKISVPDSILLKEGSLTNEEREVMITHSFVGYDILSKLRFYKIGARLVLYHHERFDGNGYPAGLKGESIPLGARILAVADCYHAMTSDRPYRKAMSSEEAISELTRCAGTQFDPKIVEVFIQVLKKNNK
ncbi:MAG: HD-GYP domain-containing protein, partial [Eubacteriales bacterium]